MTTPRVQAGDGQPEVVYCATHPNVETGLSCGRCGTPICPRWMIQTPVGARCRDCAQMRRLPTLVVGPTHYALAGAAAAGCSLVFGVIWMLIPFGGGASFLTPASPGISRARPSDGRQVASGPRG